MLLTHWLEDFPQSSEVQKIQGLRLKIQYFGVMMSTLLEFVSVGFMHCRGKTTHSPQDAIKLSSEIKSKTRYNQCNNKRR